MPVDLEQRISIKMPVDLPASDRVDANAKAEKWLSWGYTAQAIGRAVWVGGREVVRWVCHVSGKENE